MRLAVSAVSVLTIAVGGLCLKIPKAQASMACNNMECSGPGSCGERAGWNCQTRIVGSVETCSAAECIN